jgi:hypothetical protein
MDSSEATKNSAEQYSNTWTKKIANFLEFRELNVTIAFIVLCLFFYWKRPDTFLKPANLAVIMRFVATFGLLAIGELFVIITGGIDLSVGSMTALTGVIAATLMVKGVGKSCRTLAWFQCHKIGYPTFHHHTRHLAHGTRISSLHNQRLPNRLCIGLSIPESWTGGDISDSNHVHHLSGYSTYQLLHVDFNNARTSHLRYWGEHRGSAGIRGSCQPRTHI